jgi:hypothetical protein
MDVFKFGDVKKNYQNLGDLPDETIELVYQRGWPVLFAAWIASAFDYKSAFNTARFIAKNFSDWAILRDQQKQNGIKVLGKDSFFSLIYNAKGKSGWIDMPRNMFLSCTYEVIYGRTDPTNILLKFVECK